jgi:hypothetical protein
MSGVGNDEGEDSDEDGGGVAVQWTVTAGEDATMRRSSIAELECWPNTSQTQANEMQSNAERLQHGSERFHPPSTYTLHESTFSITTLVVVSDRQIRC